MSFSERSAPIQVKETLKLSDLRTLEVEVIELEQHIAEVPLSTNEITTDIFDGQEGVSQRFLKLVGRVEATVHRDLHDAGVLYLGCDSPAGFRSFVKVKKRDCRTALNFRAEDFFIARSGTTKAVSVRSMLPESQRSIQLMFVPQLLHPQNHGDTPISFFGFSSDNYYLFVQKIRTEDDVATVCHELGHAWAFVLGLDEMTSEQRAARKVGYDLIKDVEQHGWDQAKKGVEQVFFSERVANTIGRVLASKISMKSNGIVSDNFLSREFRDQQEGVYEEHYLGPLMQLRPDLFNKIRKLFISRRRRTTH